MLNNNKSSENALIRIKVGVTRALLQCMNIEKNRGDSQTYSQTALRHILQARLPADLWDSNLNRGLAPRGLCLIHAPPGENLKIKLPLRSRLAAVYVIF